MGERKVEQNNWWRKQLRITWHLPVVLGVLFVVFILVSKWNWITSSPPRVLVFEGTHQEIGLAHGKALSKEIHYLFDEYIVGGLVERDGWKLEALIKTGKHYEKYIPGEYIQEMRGISEGANIAYDHILVMNTFPDAVLGASPQACSAFAVQTEKGLLIGRNLDWTNYGVSHRMGMVFILKPNSRRSVFNIGWPGMVGCVTAMNDSGLVVTMNMAYAIDVVTNTTPVLIRLRSLLENKSSVKDAVDSLISIPRTVSMNVLVGSGKKNNAVVVELAGKKHALVPMKDGFVITTNFYQSLNISGGAGAERSAVIKDIILKNKPTFSPSHARSALSKVCFRGNLGMVTTQSIIFYPSTLSADVALGKLPASSGRYYKVTAAGSFGIHP